MEDHHQPKDKKDKDQPPESTPPEEKQGSVQYEIRHCEGFQLDGPSSMPEYAVRRFRLLKSSKPDHPSSTAAKPSLHLVPQRSTEQDLVKAFACLKESLGFSPEACDREALETLEGLPREKQEELGRKCFEPQGYSLADFLPSGAGYHLTPLEIESLRQNGKDSSAEMRRILEQQKHPPTDPTENS